MRVLLTFLVLAGCGPTIPSTTPPDGWQLSGTSLCETYGGRFVLHEHRVYCRKERLERIVGHGQSYWTREGPFEGEVLGMLARGWYSVDVREGGWSFEDDGGVVRAEGRYELLGREGRWIIRYASGLVASEVGWHRGQRNGEARWWYADGKPWWAGHYRDGRPVGRWTHWDRAGRMRPVDPKLDAVGPVTHPSGLVSGRGRSDDECPAADIVGYLEAIRARRPMRSRNVTSTGTTIHLPDGFVAGRMTPGGGAGEIVDENGLLVFRQTEAPIGGYTGHVECYDEGGRMLGIATWHDKYAEY